MSIARPVAPSAIAARMGKVNADRRSTTVGEKSSEPGM
jgi:hypothetical protein